MILTGLAKLGRDAEVRRLPDGTALANLALAVNYGKKDANGKRPTQWIDATLWGDRAEKLAPYLLKGSSLVVVLDDPHIETYQKDGVAVPKLVARVSSVEFAGSPAKPAQAQAPTPQPSAPARGFDDMDDDSLPF